MTADVFGTRALRERVLGTWRTDPARLREDANTEEDHARGYYRDRVVVELAQNAADAAVRAGVPGRLLLRLTTLDEVGAGGDLGPGAGFGHDDGVDPADVGSGDGAAQHLPPGAGPGPRDALDAPGASGLVLVAANTGAPLDAAGVASLAAMRASSSRDWAPTGAGPGLVGRFGVGFAAVRAVADEVEVLSTSGAVRFSLAATRRDLALAGADAPRLSEEVALRDGSLPALRLPREHEGRPPSGYDTAVLLHLRDAAAVAAVRAMLDGVGDALLLALPGLTEVVVEDEPAGRLRRVADVDRRWRRRTAEGELDPALVADRPVEERSRRRWRLTWALPRAAEAAEAAGTPGVAPEQRVVHAPTPTDDALDLPALLVGTLPLDPTRRRVARGPATDALLDVAADLYARLATDVVADGGDPLRLVPLGLPAGDVDAALRPRLVAELARTPLLAAPGADDEGEVEPDRVEPHRAATLAGPAAEDLVRALAPFFAGLVEVPVASLPAARALGVEVREVAEVVDELPAAAGLPPERWRDLYATLAPAVADPLVREALAALPVPLADGRVVRGARSLLLPVAGALDPAGPVARALGTLGRWGVRLVHPAAAHDVLERLGASPADPAALLAHPGVRQAVLDQAAEDDVAAAEEVSDAVLALVRAAIADDGPDEVDAPVPPARALLGLLTLRAADGEPTPAHGLVLPGSPAARLLDDRVLAPVDDAAVDRWGADALVAAGVRADLVPLVLTDVATGDDLGGGDEDADLVTDGLDGWDDYLAHVADLVGEGEVLTEVLAVADLDAVHPDAWPDVLARLASPGALRRALLDPVRASDGTAVPGYTAWWLRTRSGLLPVGPFAATGADAAVVRLLPAPPDAVAGLDAAGQVALGGVASLAQVPPTAWSALLRAAAAPGGPVDLALATAVWRAWAGHAVAVAARDAAPLPDLDVVPALVAPDRVALVHAEDAAVAPGPMWWQRTDVAAMVPAVGVDADDLADALGLPTAADLADGATADDDGDLLPTVPEVATVLPGAPATWVEHEALRVDGVPVDWWVEGSGPDAVVHATHLAGLARGLAQAAGAWPRRHAVELVLVEPARAAELAVEQVGDEVPTAPGA